MFSEEFINEIKNAIEEDQIKMFKNYLKDLTKNEKKKVLLYLTKLYSNGENFISDLVYDNITNHTKYTKGNLKLQYFIGGEKKIFYKDGNFEKWLSKNKTKNFTISAKIDGVSILVVNNLLYTRGDNEYGNVLKLDNIIKQSDLDYRAEIVVLKPDVNKSSATTVSGILHQKNENEYSKLKYFAFELLKPRVNFIKQYDIFRENGILTSEFIITQRVNLNEDFLIELFDNWKKNLPYFIDGLVIKEADTCYPLNLKTHPSWSIAFKDSIKGLKTIVTDIQWKLSRTSKHVPIAHFNEIIIENTKFKKLNCFNLKYLQEKGIGIGSELLIGKNVIAVLLKVLKTSTDIPKFSTDNPKNYMLKLKYFLENLGIQNINKNYAFEIHDIKDIFIKPEYSVLKNVLENLSIKLSDFLIAMQYCNITKKTKNKKIIDEAYKLYLIDASFFKQYLKIINDLN